MRGGAKKKANDIFHNKIVLYILLAIAIFNLLSYLGQNNLCAIVLFLAIGLTSTYYTKNMIFVLLSTIVLTNFLVNIGFLRLFGLREGAQSRKKSSARKPGGPNFPPGKGTNSGIKSTPKDQSTTKEIKKQKMKDHKNTKKNEDAKTKAADTSKFRSIASSNMTLLKGKISSLKSSLTQMAAKN